MRWFPLLLLCLTATPSFSGAFTVDDLGDGADDIPDGVCATAGSVCTLRAAIQAANFVGGAQDINFSVRGTITLGSNLPAVTEAAALIDDRATCASWYNGSEPMPAVTIDGNGFTIVRIEAAGVTVRGLGFTTGSHGVAIRIEADSAVVQCNVIDGAEKGIELVDADDCLIGGPTDGDGNVVENCDSNAIIQTHPSGSGASGNTYQGNEVLTSTTGIEVYNSVADILIDHNRSSGHTGGNGVNVTDSPGGALVTNNYLGVNRAGDTDEGNSIAGLHCSNSAGVTFDSNLTSGNGLGVRISGCTGTIVSNNTISLASDGVTDLCNDTNIDDDSSSTFLDNIEGCTPTPTPTAAPPACCAIEASESPDPELPGYQVDFGGGSFGLTCFDTTAPGVPALTSQADCNTALGGFGLPSVAVSFLSGFTCTLNPSPPAGDPLGGVLSGECLVPPPTATSAPTNTPTVTPAPPCIGDCDRNGEVAISELVLAVDIALGRQELSGCQGLDQDSSGSIGIDELVRAVRSAVRGCS